MSDRLIHILDLFDTLSEIDKRQALIEILRRSPLGETDISDAGHEALADELFSTLDEEEAARPDQR